MGPLDLDPIKVHPLIDAVPDPVPVSWPFPDVEPADWAGLAMAGLDPAGFFQPSLGAFLVEVGGKRILCDAGIGPGPNAYLGGLVGSLPQRLGAAGFMPDDIDAVVFTHLHMDHIGWAATGGVPRFARAEYVAPAVDAAFFAAGAQGMGAHHARAFEATIGPMIAAGRVRLVADDGEIFPGVRYRATPGHTPGHQSILVHAGDMTLAVCGDVFHAPAQVERPEWSHRADHDQGRARASRRAFMDAAVAGGWTLAAGHFREGLQLGRIATETTGTVWRPLAQPGAGAPAPRAEHLTTGG